MQLLWERASLLCAWLHASRSISVCNLRVSCAFVFCSLGKVREDECALLRRQLVLLLPGLLQQLLPHHSEHRAQQRPAEYLGGLVPGQTVAELRHIAVAEPSMVRTITQVKHCAREQVWRMQIGHLAALLPGVVGLVSSCIIVGNPLAPLGGRLQLPVVDLVEEHLGQLHYGLTLLRRQVAEFVLDKVVHTLFGRDKINEWDAPQHSLVLLLFGSRCTSDYLLDAGLFKRRTLLCF